MKAKDAPEGFIAYQANPRNPCQGCYFLDGKLECPVNPQGRIWCEAHNRPDRMMVVFQPEEA